MGCGYETYISKEVKTEHKEEAKADAETVMDEEEQEDPVPLVTHVHILHSIFSIVEVFINNQQISNSNGLYAYKSYTCNHFKGTISQYKGGFVLRGL